MLDIMDGHRTEPKHTYLPYNNSPLQHCYVTFNTNFLMKSKSKSKSTINTLLTQITGNVVYFVVNAQQLMVSHSQKRNTRLWPKEKNIKFNTFL